MSEQERSREGLTQRLQPVLILCPFIFLIAHCFFACSSEERSSRSEKSPVQKRIVSLTIFSDEILRLLPGVRDDVVAVSTLADNVEYSIVADDTLPEGPWPSTIPRVHTSAESILALRPTHIVAASFTRPETIHLLKQSGVPLLVLKPFTKIDDIQENGENLLSFVGADVDEFEAEDRNIDLQRNGVKKAYSMLQRLSLRPDSEIKCQTEHTLSLLALHHSGTIAGGHTLMNEAMQLSGWENAAVKSKLNGHHAIGEEGLLKILTKAPRPFVLLSKAVTEHQHTRVLQKFAKDVTHAQREHGSFFEIQARLMTNAGIHFAKLTEALASLREQACPSSVRKEAGR